MKAPKTLRVKAAILSAVVLAFILVGWYAATLPTKAVAPTLTAEQIEYAKLMGKDPKASGGASSKSTFPTPAQMGSTIIGHLSDPFYDNGPNDKGIGLQISYSLVRVGLGFCLAALFAIPLGF